MPTTRSPNTEEESPATMSTVQKESGTSAASDSPYKHYTWRELQDDLVEKDYQLECAKDRIDQLSLCKDESLKKDTVIASLRKELSAFKKNSWSKDFSYVSMKERLAAYESTLQEKTDKINILQKELNEIRGPATSSNKMWSTITQTNGAQDSLKQELAQKKSELISLQERVKVLRSMNQDLQKRLEESQTQEDNLVKIEKRLTVEVARLKKHSSDGKLLLAKHDFIEQELTKSKEKEKVMAVELARLREELSGLCENVSCLTGNSGGRNSTATVINAVSRLAQENSEANHKHIIVTQQLQQLEKKHSALCGEIDHIKQFWNDCKSEISKDALSGVNILIATLGTCSFQMQHCLKELLIVMQDVLISIHSYSSAAANKHSELAEKITTSYSTVDGHDDKETDPLSMFLTMSKMLKSSICEAKLLEQRLCGTEIEHSASLSVAIAALMHDEEVRLDSKVESLREEEEVKCSHQINELKSFWESDKKVALSKLEAKIGAVTAELENLQQQYEVQLLDNKFQKDKIARLESKLQDEEWKRKEELSTLECQDIELRKQCLEKVTLYKSQSEQYALTIIALEEKLLQLVDKCDNLQTENVDLSEKLKEKTTICDEDFKSKAEKVKSMSQLIGALRKQVHLSTKKSMEKQSRINELEEALKTAGVNKKEYEGQNLAEVSDFRQMLSSQEAILECQRAKIEQMRELASDRSSQCEQNIKKHTKEIETVKLKSGIDSARLYTTVVSHAGQKCLGEKHNEIIAKQRGVIAQLKQRIYDLQLSRPPIGSHQATLKELSRMRHELLSIKAEPASVVHQELPQVDSTTIYSKCYVGSEFQDGSTLKDALYQSERSYFHLVNTIYQNLPDVQRTDLSEFTVDSEVNDRVLKQRKQFADVVSKQLKAIQEPVRSLKSCDKKKSVWLDSQEHRSAGVITQLESMLSATSEELEQQMRLNHALNKRKSNFKDSSVI